MRIVAHMGGNGRVLQEVDLVAQSQQGFGEGLLLKVTPKIPDSPGSMEPPKLLRSRVATWNEVA